MARLSDLFPVVGLLVLTFLLHRINRYSFAVRYATRKLFNRSDLADVDQEVEFLHIVRPEM